VTDEQTEEIPVSYDARYEPWLDCGCGWRRRVRGTERRDMSDRTDGRLRRYTGRGAGTSRALSIDPVKQLPPLRPRHTRRHDGPSRPPVCVGVNRALLAAAAGR